MALPTQVLLLLLIIAAPQAPSQGTAGQPEARQGRQTPHADERELTAGLTYETVIREQRLDDGLDAQRRLDARCPGFVTAIEVDHEAGARPADALPELLSRAPALRVRSMGGLGQFSSMSLRGSSAQQVALFIDGVPLGNSLGGLVDISSLPLDHIERVEIYRGHVPVYFGSAALGGAVNLRTRLHRGADELQATAGAGSFAAAEARLATRLKVAESSSVTARVGYSGARGDFAFLADNGTPDIPSRLTTSRRVNNGYRRVTGQLGWVSRTDNWRFTAQQVALWKDQGVPGHTRTASTHTDLSTIDLVTAATARRSNPLGLGSSLEVVLGVELEQVHFRDPDNQVGVGTNDSQTTVATTYLSPRLRLPLWTDAFATAVLDLRHEWTGEDERQRQTVTGGLTPGAKSRQRYSAGAGLELEQFLLDRAAVFVPTVRFDLLDSRFAAPREDLGVVERASEPGQNRSVRTLAVSPRLGARLRLVDGLELRGSGGRYLRPPNMLELFGDRGFMRGNEQLRPETGTAVDAGFVVDIGKGKAFSLYTHAAGFATWCEDLIQWQHAGRVLRVQNMEGARIAGAEAAITAAGWHRIAVLHANYTYLHTVNRNRASDQRGKALPGRPTHELFARLSVGYWVASLKPPTEARVFYTVEHIGESFLDVSEYYSVPPRTLHGLGVEVSITDTLRLACEARNLFDLRTMAWQMPFGNLGRREVPISDYIGYPLPGRSLWVTVSINTKLEKRETPHDEPQETTYD